MYGTKPNNPRYNKYPDITITIQQPKRKINPNITIKSIITRSERNGRHFNQPRQRDVFEFVYACDLNNSFNYKVTIYSFEI